MSREGMKRAVRAVPVVVYYADKSAPALLATTFNCAPTSSRTCHIAIYSELQYCHGVIVVLDMGNVRGLGVRNAVDFISKPLELDLACDLHLPIRGDHTSVAPRK